MTHETCWELLPWLANGRLDAELQASVSTHLDGCDACRVELEFVRGIQGAVNAGPLDDESPLPGAAGFHRVLAEVDPSGATPAVRSAPAARSLWWAAAAILVVTAFTIVWQRPAPYRTLSAQESAIVSGDTVRVLFAADTSTEVLNEILGGVQGRIVDGPNSVGAYVVELPAGADVSAAIEVLRAHRSTRLVEPIGD
ncbi:hypothetical protein ABI59_22820 [Acidobacteria bacterium Mor1]|nr:hypothetical protein ABI59_22820 [Acidobacteria bacterium Mor1]